MVDLSGRVFVVTGGNGGIGLGLAEGIVMAGGSVVVWGRNRDKNDAAVEALTALGGSATAYVCDVSDEQQVIETCLLYTSPSPRDQRGSRMPSSA